VVKLRCRRLLEAMKLMRPLLLPSVLHSNPWASQLGPLDNPLRDTTLAWAMRVMFAFLLPSLHLLLASLGAPRV
jgi:hypothetical protein